MGRRYSALDAIAKDIARNVKKQVQGKIESGYGCGYVLGDAGWTNANGYHFKPCHDKDGKTISLTKGSFVRNCPQPPDGPEVTPRLASGYSVRRSACNKCPNRLPGMCCSILRERGRNAPREALKMLSDCAAEAQAAVKEMIR